MPAMNNTSNGKVIFSPQLANYLLKCGHEIQKIKVKRDRDNGEVVFIFSRSESLFKDIDAWKLQKYLNEVEYDDSF
jgi:hypothetical protein